MFEFFFICNWDRLDIFTKNPFVFQTSSNSVWCDCSKIPPIFNQFIPIWTRMHVLIALRHFWWANVFGMMDIVCLNYCFRVYTINSIRTSISLQWNTQIMSFFFHLVVKHVLVASPHTTASVNFGFFDIYSL